MLRCPEEYLRNRKLQNEPKTANVVWASRLQMRRYQLPTSQTDDPPTNKKIQNEPSPNTNPHTGLPQ